MLLALNDVGFSYKDKTALENISAEFSPGIYGILGPNGAGKSTMLHLMCALKKPNQGSITLDGKNIFEMGKTYRSKLGYMPQQQSFYDGDTVQSFLMYMAELKGISDKSSSIEEMLDNLSITDVKHDRMSTLSGGLRQRVLIAQALLGNPSILILDEPTANLDPVERIHLRTLIAQHAQKRITLIATHIVSDIAYVSNEILILQHGKLLTKQSQSALLEQSFAYNTEQLPKDGPYKLVNIYPSSESETFRIVSHRPMPYSRSQTTLDDVYIDWLGK